MPLFIKDDETADLVTTLARRLQVPKQTAVKFAVLDELKRLDDAIPLRERLATLRSEHRLPPKTGHAADKAFFDELSGET